MRLSRLRPSTFAIGVAAIATGLLVPGACTAGPTEVGRGACPADPLQVVVTVSPWSDLVKRLGGDCVSLTTIIDGAATDPHDYEPTPADSAAIEHAGLVVSNGAGYDQWAQRALDAADPAPPHLSAAAVAGIAAGDDPHLWYAPQIVERTVDAVATRLRHLLPTAMPYLTNRATETATYLAGYHRRVTELHRIAAGRTFAATEPVFDRMAAALGLVDVTPQDYRRSIRNDSEPSPAGLLELRNLIDQRRADLLVVNPQTDGPGPQRLRDAARTARIGVVSVSETPPPRSRGFVAWQLDQLNAIGVVLGG